jgi:D-amino peptidase
VNFIIVTDVEGVTGVTTFEQAEKSDYAKAMLMHDLNAVIKGIKSTGIHEIILFDMHTDGRNINLEELPGDVSVITGKPINQKVYKSAPCGFDGLFLLGLHAMASAKTLLSHTYLREYEKVTLNGRETGEIGIETALAAEQGIPLVFLSGDDAGCLEAETSETNTSFGSAVYAAVKKSLGETQGICYPPSRTGELLFSGAREAALGVMSGKYKNFQKPAVKSYKINICISPSKYREKLKISYPGLFIDERTISFEGEHFLTCWSEYLLKEKEISGL